MGAMAVRGGPVDEMCNLLSAAILADSKKRSNLIARNTKRSAVVSAASVAVAALFFPGMPLHSFFSPWGKILLLIAGLIFGVALCDAAMFVDDRRSRFVK